MGVIAFLVAVVLTIGILLRWRQRWRQLSHQSANAAATSGEGGFWVSGPLGRTLVVLGILFEVVWVLVIVGYIALLIWTFTVGPIKSVHEWFAQ